MNYRKLILLAITVLPWLSFPFLGKQAIKRFTFASIFAGVLILIQSVIAYNRGWWKVYTRLIPNVMGEVPFVIGPFYIGALWILKLTYGKFMRYSLTNLGVDFFHIYVFVAWLKKLGIAALIRLKNYQALLLFTANALAMYGFQFFIDKKINPKKKKSLIKRIFTIDF